MEEIDFSKFAQLTAPILKRHMSQAEYARTLLMLACDFSGVDNDPISQRSEEVLKSYYVGNRGISSLASEIARYTDAQVFERYLDNLDLRFDAEMALYKALSPYCPTMTDTSVYPSAAELLNRIILRASRQKRGTAAGAQSRKPGDEAELSLIQESNGKCALCSKRILAVRKGVLQSSAVITRITPESLDSVERLAYEREGIAFPEAGTLDDYIALCPSCASSYKCFRSPEQVRRALEAKEKLRARQSFQERLCIIDVESEIVATIEALCNIKQQEIARLRMDALELCNKITANEPLLKDRVSNDVAKYYRFIEENFRRQARELGTSFDSLVAAQVRLAFESIKAIEGSQSTTYQLLVDWLQEKACSDSREACEIVISFFVQNCEVFDELPE